jgi:hypothetical protein
MKTTLIWMLVGALIGAVVASFIVPPALSWYTSPGGLPQGAQIQSVVQIPEIIRYATSHLIRGQLIGGVIGSVVGLGIAFSPTFRRASEPWPEVASRAGRGAVASDNARHAATTRREPSADRLHVGRFSPCGTLAQQSLPSGPLVIRAFTLTFDPAGRSRCQATAGRRWTARGRQAAAKWRCS